MAKHKVKVQYVTEVDAASQQEALIAAADGIPGTTTNIHIECWTPKPAAIGEELKVDELIAAPN